MPKISPDEDLLTDLNNVANFVIGNEKPEDCSFNERTTLPESLAYLMSYPTNILAIRDAKNKMKKLSSLVDIINKKIHILSVKSDIKNRKSE
jgi:hypothetical protein